MSPSRRTLMEKWAKTALLRLLSKMRHGQIVLQDGKSHRSFGKNPELKVHVTVLDPGFYTKVLFGGSIGAGEAYADHLWEVDNLTQLMRIMVLNMDLLDKLEDRFSWLVNPLRRLSHAIHQNSKKGARRNILSHYDLGNQMFQSFLDPSMMYSSAIYPTPRSSLEEASLHKLETICHKLTLGPSDRVIEIGSGWGGFAIYAARNFGCHVTTTTISRAQYEEAQKRIKESGLEDRITLLNKDYRDLTGQYDKLVSIEMIEAVGHRFLPAFFKKCGKLLHDGGIMLLQAITIQDQRYEKYIRSVDFTQRHIFPGGSIVSNRTIISLMAEHTDLVARQLEDFGFDYARTLSDWRQRFIKAYPALKKQGYDETFKRLWEFYLCFCEGGFLERSISVVHLLATRPGNRSNLKMSF